MSQEKPFATDELNQLQREINVQKPTDILQFCANYFNGKLQAQRSQLWSQQHRAQAAGLNLFPPVDNVSFPTGAVHDSQPSFKSPFADNCPHLNHQPDADEPPSGATVGSGLGVPAAVGAAGLESQNASTNDGSGLFKSNFDVKTPSNSKTISDVAPNDPRSSETSAPASKSSKIPFAFNANRRTSVSAEALNPDKFKSDSWKPPINNLTEEQTAELTKTLTSNFLFQQLDANSKKTVVAALTKKTFTKGTKIIVQGDEGDYFYIIGSGQVDFYVNGSKVNSSGEGSSFGELALMYNSPRAATATAATDVTCWALDRLTFRRILLEGTFNRRLMYEDFLKDVEILKTLSSHERSKLADALSTEIYHKGDKIVTEGEQGENFYFIESGNCRVYKNDTGDIKNLTKGDYFGEIALLNDLPRQATVEALDQVIVATLGKSGFQRLLGPAVEVLKSNAPTSSAH